MSSSDSTASPTGFSTSKRKPFPRIAFAVFLIVGAGIFNVATLGPALQIHAAQKWEETPCLIDSSGVVAKLGVTRGIRNYRINIAYHYRFRGADYTSNQYQFTSGWSSGKSGKADLVDRYPPGSATVCFVNPAQPAEAVLNRGSNGEMAYGLIGLVLAVSGTVGLFSRKPATFDPAV